MYERLMSMLFTGLFLMISASLVCAQTTHVVRQDGNGDFTTVSAAVAAAGTGDTISVEDLSDVTYDEPTMAVSSKDLDIIKNTNAVITLTKSAGPSGQNQGLFYVTSSTVLLSGFQIFDTSGCAMEVGSGGDVTMEDCIVSGCDGNGTIDLAGEDDTAIDVHDGGILTMNNVQVDDSLRTGHHYGPALSAIFDAVVTCNNCKFVTEANPYFDGGFNLADVGIVSALGGNITLNDCSVEADGESAIFIGGAGSLATVTLNRCVVTPNDTNAGGFPGSLVSLALDDCVLNATNTVFDAEGQQTASDEACIVFGVPGFVNLNYCDVIRGYNGVIAIGDPTDLKVTNCLIGLNDEWGVKWVLQGGDLDSWFESNHFWANPTGHYPTAFFAGNTSQSDVDNTLGEEPDGSDAPWAGIEPTLFNYQVVNTLEVEDLGVSTLLGTTSDDLDETSIRPRSLANDKGAQEGFLIPNPASVGSSWSVYR